MITKFNNFILKLNESSIYDLDIYSILTDKYMENVLCGIDSIVEHYIEIFKMENDIDMNVDDSEITDNPDFLPFIKAELEFELHDRENTFKDLIDENDGKITIWREMGVPPNWLEHIEKQGKHIGICWSWKKEAAEAHSYQSRPDWNTVLIKTSVKEEYVNWHTTYILNISPCLGEDEKEIRLYKNTPLYIEEIEINGKTINIDNIKEKQFLS